MMSLISLAPSSADLNGAIVRLLPPPTEKRDRNQPDLKDTPVIMLTAICEAHDIAAASSYGIADYITKPFDFTELMEKITNALGNKKFG